MTHARLADYIRAEMELILQDWEVFAKTIFHAQNMDQKGLRDHAKGMLLDIADDLDTSQSESEQSAKSKGYGAYGRGDGQISSADLHGAERHGSGFSVKDTISEFRALRASVVLHWTRAHPTLTDQKLEDLTRFHEAIDQALAESMDHYSSVKEMVIQQKNLKLEQTIIEKDKFFSIIAHDLKSPMAGYLALTKMLSEKFSSLPLKDLRKMASQLAQSSENMYNLLENLLEWSLMQRDMMPFKPKTFFLIDPVKRNFELFEAATQDKEITLHSEVAEETTVFADKLMLDTVIRNLLSNAIKFSRDGGKIDVSSTINGHMLTVAVRDNGIGIPPETLKDLFVLDRKNSKRGTAGEQGTGLGLLLCKEFTQKHGGRIWAESKHGEGSTFYFSLPTASSEEIDSPAGP
ncbi:sensor histidine kinase [Desulfonatronum parangueonense]